MSSVAGTSRPTAIRLASRTASASPPERIAWDSARARVSIAVRRSCPARIPAVRAAESRRSASACAASSTESLDLWAGDTEATGQLHPTRLPTPGNVSIDIWDGVGIHDTPPHPHHVAAATPEKTAAEPEIGAVCRTLASRTPQSRPTAPLPLASLARQGGGWRATQPQPVERAPRQGASRPPGSSPAECATTTRACSRRKGAHRWRHTIRRTSQPEMPKCVRAAVLPRRGRRRTGEAGEHWVPDVDRLLSAVGLEFERPSRAHTRVIGQRALRSVPLPIDGAGGAFVGPGWTATMVSVRPSSSRCNVLSLARIC